VGFALAPLPGQSQLPKPILDLFLSNAVDSGGVRNNTGTMGVLNISARFTSTAPCVTEKAPGRIGIKCRVYIDKSIINPIQISAQEQMFTMTLRHLEAKLIGIKHNPVSSDRNR
jgi:hypothetical protein